MRIDIILIAAALLALTIPEHPAPGSRPLAPAPAPAAVVPGGR